MKRVFLSITLLAALSPLTQASAEVGSSSPMQCRNAIFQYFFSPDLVEYHGTFKDSGELCKVTLPIDDAPPKLSISSLTRANQNRTIDLSEATHSTANCLVRPGLWMYWEFSANGASPLRPALRIEQVDSKTVSVQILNTPVGFKSDITADSCQVTVQ